MIFSWLKKYRTIYYSSFLKFSDTLIKVQNTSSTISKKKIFSEYYCLCNPDEQTSVLTILNFIRDRPKTGLATRSLVNFLSNKYLSSESAIENDLESIMKKLEDKDKIPKVSV